MSANTSTPRPQSSFRIQLSREYVRSTAGPDLADAKPGDLSSTQGALCTVSVFFYFTCYSFGGVHTRPTHPAAYGPVTMGPTKADKPIEVQLEAWTRVDPRNSQRHKWT